MTKKSFYLTDPKDLDLRFYQAYDEAFLLRKAEVIVSIVDDIDEFKKFLFEDNENNDFEKEKYIETLNADLYFSEFQQFEAFFAILIATFQELPHWLYLTTYTTREIKQKVVAFLDGDIDTASNGLVSDIHKFINETVYANFMSDKSEIAQNWETNIENIVWFIKRLSKKYIEGTEYNAYKHGLRTMTGPTYFRMFPTGEPDKGISYASDDSIRFLELEKVEDNAHKVKEVYKHFNPIESLNHIYFMSGILETIKSVRLARIKGEKHARINSFTQLDRDNLNELCVVTRWSRIL